MKRSFSSYAESLALLLLRLSLGSIFITHGSQKLLGAFGGPGLTATFKAFRESVLPYLPPRYYC
jgi:putative oxidoreductase